MINNDLDKVDYKVKKRRSQRLSNWQKIVLVLLIIIILASILAIIILLWQVNVLKHQNQMKATFDFLQYTINATSFVTKKVLQS